MNAKEVEGTFVPAVQPRVGHVSVAANDFMLVWGGYNDENHSTEKYLSTDKIDLFHTDLDEGYWTTHKTKGNIPLGTSGAVAILVKHSLYIFGGHSELGRALNDLYCCDLRTMTWEKIVPAEGRLPSPRDKFTGWHYNNRLYYFGGYGIICSDYDEEDFLMDNGNFIRNFENDYSMHSGWNDQLIVYDLEENIWTNPACKGFPPSARAAQASMIIDNIMYLFGGRHQQKRLDDLHCLNMDTLTWSGELTTDGPVPCGRSWHSLTAISEYQGFMYGGYSQSGAPLSDAWVLDVTVKQWSRLDVPSNRPRLWHTTCCTVTGDILVFGGCEGDILSYEVDPVHSNEVLKFRLRPQSLQRLCQIVMYKHVSPTCWDDLPKILSDWLHKKEKLEKLRAVKLEELSHYKRGGSTCAIS